MYKKVSVLILLVLLALPLAFAEVSITKSFSGSIAAGEETQAVLTVTADTRANNLEINELTPNGWIITGWELENYDKVNTFYETRDYSYNGKEWTLSHWVFNKPFAGTLTITYEMTPKELGKFQTLTLWNYEGGFSELTTQLTVNPKGVPETAVQPEFPTDKPAIQIPGITFDLTLLAAITIVCGFLIAGILLVILSSKGVLELIEKIKHTSKNQSTEQVAVEDLRAFIKLGLRRGYTLREMINALKAGNIETKYFNEIAREEMIASMNETAMQTEKVEMDSEYIKRLKEIIKNMGKRKA